MKAKIISEIFLMAVITGCSTVLVQSDYDREINFTNFHTFDWTTQSENTGSNADQRITLFERRLKKSVDKELTANGFQKQTAERPDFLIAYSIQVEDQVNVLSSGYGYGYGGYSYRGYGLTATMVTVMVTGAMVTVMATTGMVTDRGIMVLADFIPKSR